MKRLTDKQKALLQEFAPEIAHYRAMQGMADNVEVTDFESAEIAGDRQAIANEALSDLKFWVQEAYSHVPYRETRNKAIRAFMRLVVEGE